MPKLKAKADEQMDFENSMTGLHGLIIKVPKSGMTGETARDQVFNDLPPTVRNERGITGAGDLEILADGKVLEADQLLGGNGLRPKTLTYRSICKIKRKVGG